MDYKVKLKEKGVSDEQLAQLASVSNINWEFLFKLVEEYNDPGIVGDILKVLNLNG